MRFNDDWDLRIAALAHGIPRRKNGRSPFWYMKIWLRQSPSSDLIGPLTFDEVRSQIQAGMIGPDFEALEASGQSFTALKRSTEWNRLSQAFPQLTPLSSSESGRAITSLQKTVGVPGACSPEITELLQRVIANQNKQLDALSGIRWTISCFGILFAIRFVLFQ